MTKENFSLLSSPSSSPLAAVSNGRGRTRRRRHGDGNATRTTTRTTTTTTSRQRKNLLATSHEVDENNNVHPNSSRNDDHSDTCLESYSSSTNTQKKHTDQNRKSHVDKTDWRVLLQEFEMACQESTVVMDYWSPQQQESPRPLASAIVSASYNLSYHLGTVDHSSLLLDGAAPSLLTMSTKMIQEAMQRFGSSNSNNNSNNPTPTGTSRGDGNNSVSNAAHVGQSLLVVAIHSLRAIVRRLDRKKLEKLLKTLYHATVLCSEQAIQQRLPKNDKDEPTAAAMAYTNADLCWKAIEAMKVTLLMSYCQQEDRQCNVAVDDSRDHNGVTRFIGFSIPPQTEAQSLFPIPRIWTSKKQLPSSSLVRLDLSMDKLVTVAVQACMAFTKLLFQLASCASSSSSSEKDDNLLQLFHSWKISITSSSGKNFSMSTTFQQWGLHLAGNTAMEWIWTLSAPNDMITLAKKMYRLVWERAAAHPTNHEQALLLRQVALRILLLHGHGNESRRGVWLEKDSVVGTAQALRRTGVWETACTSAWKVACTFQQQAQQRTDSLSSSLHHAKLVAFHEKVGGVLDQLALGLPLPYVEYCAYRAYHLRDSAPSFYCVFQDDGSHSFQRGKALMHLFISCMQVKEALSHEEPQNRRQTPAISDDQIVKEIQSCDFDNVAEEHLRRILKPFNMLSLHRTIYNSLVGDRTEREVDAAALRVAARLSIQGTALLYLRQLELSSSNGGDSASSIATEWELYVETMLRGIAAYEWLLRNSHASLRRTSDTAMIGVVNVLVRQNVNVVPPPLACIEKAAKVRERNIP